MPLLHANLGRNHVLWCVLHILAGLRPLIELRIVNRFLVAQLRTRANHHVHVGHPLGDLAHLGHGTDVV